MAVIAHPAFLLFFSFLINLNKSVCFLILLVENFTKLQ